MPVTQARTTAPNRRRARRARRGARCGAGRGEPSGSRPRCPVRTVRELLDRAVPRHPALPRDVLLEGLHLLPEGLSARSPDVAAVFGATLRARGAFFTPSWASRRCCSSFSRSQFRRCAASHRPTSSPRRVTPGTTAAGRAPSARSCILVGVVPLPVHRPPQRGRVPVRIDRGQRRGSPLRACGVLPEPAGAAHVREPLPDLDVHDRRAPRPSCPARSALMSTARVADPRLHAHAESRPHLGPDAARHTRAGTRRPPPAPGRNPLDLPTPTGPHSSQQDPALRADRLPRPARTRLAHGTHRLARTGAPTACP